jgi:hypothetical protein
MKRTVLIGIGGGLALAAGWMLAQNQPVVTFTATSSNVSGAGDAIRIDILRWSTDAERDQLVAAWTNPGAPARGRGAAKGRGAAEDDPFGAGNDPQIGRGGAKGKGGAKGGGKGKGGAGADAPPVTPEGSLASAIEAAPAVGRLWSSEVAGYSLRYAARIADPAGGERILLVTNRRLGAWNDLWKPAGGSPTNYEFSVIELRLNAQGEGEGKASLVNRIAVDGAAKTIGLEDYAAAPVILQNVKRRSNP